MNKKIIPLIDLGAFKGMEEDVNSGMRIPKVSHVKFNKYVKEIARLAGIREPVRMTHKEGNRIGARDKIQICMPGLALIPVGGATVPTNTWPERPSN